MSNQVRCIAHEIRNQISICELYTQIIKRHLEKDGYKNESVNNALLCINKAVKIMSNNLLDLKSLDTLNLKEIELQNILKTGIDMSTVYAQNKDIKINFVCPDKITVSIDENKFLACIINIIKNAIEAIEEKGEINVCAEVNDAIHIKISNNGEPIPVDVQEHLFDEGFTTKKTGSGLGLAICKENLNAQNADLKLIKSNKEKTEFEIILPAV